MPSEPMHMPAPAGVTKATDMLVAIGASFGAIVALTALTVFSVWMWRHKPDWTKTNNGNGHHSAGDTAEVL